MRFSFASVALLALAHLLAPGVHGAPAVVSDHTNSLTVRQLPGSVNELVNAVLEAVLGLVNTSGNLGSAVPISAELAQQLAQQIAQKLQNGTASGMLARGPSSSESTSPTTLLPTTTTSHDLPVSTDRIGESTVSSVSTPQASPTPKTRMRRQLSESSGLPSSVLSEVLSIVSPKSTALPVQSILASVLSVASSKLGSVASQSAVSKPTPSKH